MMRNKVGRNTPCPCGSGKKAKRCCFGVIEGGRGASASDDALGEIREALGAREFGSLDEVQALLDKTVETRNRTALPAFQGLTPEQMHRLLHFPFDSPEVLVFPDPIEGPVSAPIATLFEVLADHLGEGAMKPTAKGNLPRAVVLDILGAYEGKGSWDHDRWSRKINKEEDFPDLEQTRIVAEIAGLVRKYRGRFILGRECRKLLSANGMAGVYPRLLRTYVQRFNWAYCANYPEVPFLQQSFGFTLYLLHRFGATKRPNEFYEDAFLEAFPRILHEVPQDDYFDPERLVRNMYRLLVLDRFANRLGLASLEEAQGSPTSRRDFLLEKTPFLDRVVRFRV